MAFKQDYHAKRPDAVARAAFTNILFRDEPDVRKHLLSLHELYMILPSFAKFKIYNIDFAIPIISA